MSYRMIGRIVGRVIGIIGVLMVLPLIVAAYYGESIRGFLVAIGAAAVLCGALLLLTRSGHKSMFSKEGFVSVSISWIIMSVIGAIPFIVEGEIPNFFDAFFETVSGFTTTGSTILENPELMSRGLLFWRSFTHWIGGMGILVLMMAIVPLSEQYSMYIMRAEVPGPEAGKLVPKVQHSSRILYLIYVALTLIEVIFLLFGKMPLYDALVHSFGTAGTGGFSTKLLSIGHYNSAYIETVIGIFMIVFGINFNLYFLLLMKKVRRVLHSEELWFYLAIVAASVAAIALNIRPIYGTFGTALRYSFFQVTSIISTTGYSSANFDMWPEFSKMLLVLLMFIGSCAGSTAGGIKVSRIMILLRSARSEIKHLLRPRSYNSVMMDGKEVNRGAVHCTLVFFFLYILIILGSILLISLENFDTTTTVTSVITCISNVGPGLSMVGPAGSFAAFSGASKVLLSICMLMGRLEIFPILILFSRSTWRRRSRF